MTYPFSMRHYKLRLAINAIAVILIIISKIIIRKKRKIVYFNANTGQARYRIVYYTLIFIPIFYRTKTIPNKKYAVQ